MVFERADIRGLAPLDSSATRIMLKIGAVYASQISRSFFSMKGLPAGGLTSLCPSSTRVVQQDFSDELIDNPAIKTFEVLEVVFAFACEVSLESRYGKRAADALCEVPGHGFRPPRGIFGRSGFVKATEDTDAFIVKRMLVFFVCFFRGNWRGCGRRDPVHLSECRYFAVIIYVHSQMKERMVFWPGFG